MSNNMEEHPYNEHLDCQPMLLTSVSYPSPSFQIVFRLSCDFTISRWELRNVNSLESTILEDHFPLMTTIVPMGLADFIIYPEKAYAILNQSITNWPLALRGPHQNNFINLTLAYGRDAVNSMGATHNYVYIHMRMKACLYQVFEQALDVSGMIPASDSSIESLETRKISCGSCPVCWEEFSGTGASMPCQHVFHGDCIKKWLKISHFCPLCRFEMPTI